MSIILANFGKYAISDCPFIYLLGMGRLMINEIFLPKLWDMNCIRRGVLCMGVSIKYHFANNGMQRLLTDHNTYIRISFRFD